jgi:hypothetical protein
MLHNDLDDTSPPRCLVHSSTVADSVPQVTRKLFMPTVGRLVLPRDVDIALMNDLSDKGLKMVLYGYTSDPVSPEKVLKEIDQYHHPFNEWLEFDSPADLTHYLAMQNDVRHVIDRIRPLAFGSRNLQI